MAENSKIEWTDHTANFWWGCFKVSPGCQHCYADTLAHRYGKDIWGPVKTTSRELKTGIWKELPKWNRDAENSGQRRRVFVMSMGDFFEDHPQVGEWRRDALHLISQLKSLDFQILTKRPENVIRMIEAGTGRRADAWLTDCDHVWIGTSVENQEQADKRIPELLKIPARVLFLSMEPLLGSVNLETWLMPDDSHPSHGILCGDSLIDWVIVGGESGPNARPMHPDWARSIRDQCQAAGVPFFFKQWGEFIPFDQDRNAFDKKRWSVTTELFPGGVRFAKVGKYAAGRLLDGREWNELPF